MKNWNDAVNKDQNARAWAMKYKTTGQWMLRSHTYDTIPEDTTEIALSIASNPTYNT